MTKTVEIKGSAKVKTLELTTSVYAFQIASGELEIKIEMQTLEPDVLMSALEFGLRQKFSDAMAAKADTPRKDRIARVEQVADNLRNGIWSLRSGDGSAATAIEPIVRRLFLTDIAEAQGVDISDTTKLNKAVAELGKADSFKGKKGFELIAAYAQAQGEDEAALRAEYVERANIEREAQAEAAKAVATLDLSTIKLPKRK